MDTITSDINAPSAFKVKPMAHQLEYYNIAKGKRYFADGMEQGLGKTFSEINVIARLWSDNRINNVIIFAPNGVHANWHYNEIPKFMPDWVRYISAIWSSSQSLEIRKGLEKLFHESDSTKLRIFCVNWEAIQRGAGRKVVEKFCMTSSKLLIICDESQYIANPSSERFKFLTEMRKYSTARRIVSGTFMYNSPFDLFSQFSFLDQHILRTTSYFAFKSEYGVFMPSDSHAMKRILDKIEQKTGKRPKRAPQIEQRDDMGRPQYRNMDKLQSLISPYMFRKTKSECLDLPEKMYTCSYYEMSGKQKDAYDLMKKQCRVIFDDGYETAVSKLVAIGKLSQITSNFIIDSETKIIHDIDEENPKLELLKSRLMEHCIEYGKQAIVFCWFRNEIKQIEELCNEMNLTNCTYYGDVNNEDRINRIKSFENGEISVFIAQLRSASTGLTLVAASRVIYYNDTFSLGMRNQSEDRAHRIGQVNNVIYENLICKGCIDEVMLKAREAKQEVFDYLMDNQEFLR